MTNHMEKPKTKEELSDLWKKYYDWIDSAYPVESFDIQGENGENLTFFRGTRFYKNDTDPILYFAKDPEYKELYERQKQRNLLGEEDNEIDLRSTYPSKAFIGIYPEEKKFNFGVEYGSENKGYARMIYQQYLHILELLGLPDKEQYSLSVRGSSDHNFLKRMQTEQFIAQTEDKPNQEKASKLLAEFANYPNTLKFSEFNTLIQYAIDSHIPISKIAEAINQNGFHIYYTIIDSDPDFSKQDLEKFESFGITGLKPTAMHHHFTAFKSFGFMKLLRNIDTKDATLEFKRFFEEIKKQHEENINEGPYMRETIEKYGELEYMLLNCSHFELLLKHVSPEIQETVKQHAINKFDQFDTDHEYDWSCSDIDYNSSQTFKMLKEAGLMDKDAYIALYQKALNRNYDLKEFDRVISPFIDEEERKVAKEEIGRNAFYPYPKGNWQTSASKEKRHKIARIPVSAKLLQKGDIIGLLKQEILKQGTATKTKIRTDMTGKAKNGYIIPVDNLKNWLFGVPGAHGNLKLTKRNQLQLPPQTPDFAVNLVKDTIQNIEYPNQRQK